MNPCLRPVDVRRIRHEGSTYFVLRDPLRIAEQQLLIPEHYAPILARFDGETEVARIISDLEAEYQVRVSRDVVDELVDVLDHALMLESARFAERLLAARREYRDAPFRTPALAGTGYPAEPDALRTLLDQWLVEAGDVDAAATDWQGGHGLLSPHIDYERGGSVYARVWKRAAQAAAEADLVILFGTDHFGDDAFTLTRQHYATPYGVLPTATGLVDALAASLGEEAAYAGELRHRGEHSLELVLTWLHHMRQGRPVEVAPILCGSLSTYMRNGDSPRADQAIDALLGGLRAAAQGRRTLVVASGDLAHVGVAFGQNPLTESSLQKVRGEDERLIERMAAGDAEGFFAAIKRVGNRYNVCGVTPIYLTMRLLGGLPGEAMGYRVCPADAAAASAVTVAGLYFGGAPKAG